MADGRVFSPAVARNRDPILEVLRRILPGHGEVLEVASGTGEHAWYFARHLPHLVWQPSEVAESAFGSIEAWRLHDPVVNLRTPIVLDATAEVWPVSAVTAVFCANMVHISPWPTTCALVRGSARHVVTGGRFVLYGPFRIGGVHTAPSNEAFDRGLRARDPRWGVRDYERVVAEAQQHGLELVERIAMPANNFTLVFEKR